MPGNLVQREKQVANLVSKRRAAVLAAQLQHATTINFAHDVFIQDFIMIAIPCLVSFDYEMTCLDGVLAVANYLPKQCVKSG